MTRIKKYVDRIDEELEDAKHYAEMYVECKAKSKGNTPKGNMYHDMSEDELKHATYLHDMAIDEIDELETVFRPTEEMKKMWQDSHSHYVEKTAWIRQMLLM